VVAPKLAEWGIEVHRGVGGTGVGGALRSGNREQAIGLRADSAC
jgi:metal-dependent amidase/aminoacylase/carboxypeptidase family protein